MDFSVSVQLTKKPKTTLFAKKTESGSGQYMLLITIKVIVA